MTRVLSLQRLALDNSASVMGNSSGSSTHSCCDGGSKEQQQ